MSSEIPYVGLKNLRSAGYDQTILPPSFRGFPQGRWRKGDGDHVVQQIYSVSLSLALLQAQNIEKYGIVRMKDVGGSYQHLIDWSTEAKEQKRK